MKRTFLVAALVSVFSSPAALSAQEITPELYSSLRYRHIGPGGNRASAVVGIPGDIMTYYVGASSGGIFKSTDAGLNWEPIFDDQEAQSIGALAIAPSDPNVVWAGTGEAFIRSNVSLGNGIYKSTDAGKTWEHMGLTDTGRIGRVVIHPTNPDIVHAAALGHCYGPQQERGVYRTTDGGETWKRVLFADEDTGCFEIVVNPQNPRIMFAGMWPMELKTYGRESGGPGGGIYRSRDGGETWHKLEGRGLPGSPIGKVGLAIADSNPDVVYALMETGTPNRGVLWRSTDSGDSWSLMSYDRLLNERPHYASRIVVNPGDENEVYFSANSHSITYDGGVTTERTGWSGDSHDMWCDPTNPDRFMISDDGGAIITLNHGKSWARVDLPNAQMYHVAVDNEIPYNVYGGMQDGSGYKGPSTGGGRRGGDQWKSTAGGECGFILPDPVNSNIVWGGSFNAGLTRVDYSTGHRRTVKVWPESAYGAAAKDVRYRFNWTFPIAISPHDNNKVYTGSQYVHVTEDAGQSWRIISPDLTTNDKSLQQPSGGLTKDNLAVEYGCTLFAITESRVQKDLIWVGSNDGLVHVTKDGGKTWENVTKNIPDLPPLGTVTNIEPSPHDAATAYMTVDFHQMNGRDPYVYRTRDYGQTWKSISSNLPRNPLGYAQWVHEDPKREGLLYVGTENAIHVSFDAGERWLPLQNNLPHVPVHHMVVQEHFDDLVVGTYGRGFWIIDDITPLQQLTDPVLAADAHLFRPRAAYRMHSITGGPRVTATASLNYYVKDPSIGPATIRILDSEGELVRTLQSRPSVGINRVSWDLKYESARKAKLRIRPEANPHVVEEKRYRDTWVNEGWYPIESWGTGGGFSGITVAPGNYTVELEIGGQQFTQTLEVRKDPRSAGTQDDIVAQVKMQLELRDDINLTTDMIDAMEVMRKQLVDLKGAAGSRADATAVVEAASKFDGQIAAIEDLVLQPVIREGDTKSFRYPNLLYSKLSVLAGDVSSNVDFAPNAQQRELQEELRIRMQARLGSFQQLLNNELPAFNAVLQQNGFGGVILPAVERR